jgi:hypothetical protein
VISSLLGILPISRGLSTQRPCSDFPSQLSCASLARARG